MAKPAAPPPPPPAPPAAAPRAALAPTLVEMPANTPDPTKELAARQKAGLERIAAARRTAEGDDREGPPPPPKDRAPSASAGAASSEKGSSKSGKETLAAASPDTSGTAAAKKDDSSTPDSGTPKETSAPKELRYDLKSLGRWAEKHPEEAKEFGEKILKVKVDEEWIKLSNKKRRLREDVQERSAAGIAAAEEKLAQALREKAIVDGAVEKLTPVADLWEAVGGRLGAGHPIDFDAAEAAFFANTGVQIDDFMKQRARRGIINPEMARMRAENARLKREAEAKAKPAEPEAKAAEPEEKPKASEPNKKVPDWAEDIEKKHPLRKFDGWKADLAEAMAKHYDEDLDEYDADVEDVADKLAKRKMRELQGEEEQEEKPKAKKRVAPAAEVARPKPKRAPADAPQFSASDITGEPDDDDDPALLSGNGLDWQKRVKRAHERALRAVQERGE